MEWKRDFWSFEPVWKAVPNIEVVKRTVMRALGINDLSYYRIDISFLDQGAFNKVYKVVVGNEAYAMRVSLPVCPHWKLESEVATMKFVKERTSTPVPTVIAYDSSTDNELGYEWLLMTFISGTSLHVNWRQRSMQSKEHIVRQLAAIQKDLLKAENKFGGIGSIYSVSGHPGTYGVGHAIMLEHWVRACADPSKTYGPFSTVNACFKNKVDTRIETQEWLEQQTDDYDDEDAFDEPSAVIEILKEVQELLDDRLPEKRAFEWTYLHHQDLHFENILVDENDRVVGILDWEFTTAQPKWLAISTPKFMYDTVRETKPNRDDYGSNYKPEPWEKVNESRFTYYGDHEGKSELYWEALIEWEMTQLRKVFDAEMRKYVPDYDKIKEDGADCKEYMQVLKDVKNAWSRRYLWKWLACVWNGKEVKYQDVVDAARNGTIDIDPQFQIEYSDNEEGMESEDEESKHK